MNSNNPNEKEWSQLTKSEQTTVLFANLIIQQSNMAMMFLGKVANPETKETILDLDTARMFIDQLEMLREKTKGNLSKEELDVLNNSLMSVQMAYVEANKLASNKPPSTSAPSPSNPDTATPTSNESPKRFTKSY